MESRGPGSDAAAVAVCCPAPVTLLYDQQMFKVSILIFLFLFVFSRDATFTCARFSFGAGRWAPQGCANKNAHFIRQYSVSFRAYRYLIADIRIIFTVNRIILTDNCYGAPWGNAAVLCGLLDGVEINRSVRKKTCDGYLPRNKADICSG